MKYKVLVCDDSSFFRKSLVRLISKCSDLDVIAQAENGEEAIEMIKKHRPDVVTMDVTMPIMDGITAVRKIMKNCPTPVLMLSALTQEGARATFDAMEAGAFDFLPKNIRDTSGSMESARQEIHDKLIAAIQSKSQLRRASAPRASAPSIAKDTKKIGIKSDVVLIGTSTGGPIALQKVLEEIPGNFPLPIVMVQHMPESFTGPYAQRLDKVCALHIKEAKDGDELKAGEALLAPGGWQISFVKVGRSWRVKIQRGDEKERYKPSVDLAFTSAAQTFQANALAIILTGMGADGREGAKLMKNKGANIWAQDEASCVVFGMPQAVINAGIVDAVVTLEDFSHKLIREFC